MIKIAFIKTNFYLPEINAYTNYLKKVKNIDSEILTNTKDVDNNHSHIWFFMGFNFKKYKQNVIHEYNSLSIPPFTETKNFIKKTFNINLTLEFFK